MDADLDLLLTTVFVTADDLLPERQNNAARRVTDAEVVTLCVAQAIMGIPSDRRFLAVAAKRLGHLFPRLPKQPGYFKRRLAETLEWLMGVFASQSPGFDDDLLLIDSIPGRVRAQPRDGPALGAGRRRRLRLLHQPQPLLLGLPVARDLQPGRHPALELTSPKLDERDIALVLLERCQRRGGETLLGDKGYAGREFAAAVSARDATIVRPRRKDEPGSGPHLAPIRQRIESIFWTCKDLLTLERHGARTLAGLRERILARFCCLAAAISLNHQLGRPSRALVNYCA
jgi:hypothetical protein